MAYDMSRLRPLALCLAAALLLAYAATALSPQRYIATARALLPAQPGQGSRILKIEHSAGDPLEAAALAARELSAHGNVTVLDEAIVLPAARRFALHLALGAALGLALGLALVLARERRRRPVRTERELIAALGVPLLAARPLQPEALRGLCLQLLEHWFSGDRTLLPVVSAGRKDGRTRLAAQLARGFAALGVRTLLIDADLRSPGQHREFGLPNRRGLSDFLAGRPVQMAACGEHLAVLVAGTARADPVALLGCERLGALLAASGKPFRVVLVDTPAAQCGPDMQIFAALAGGALVAARRSRAEAGALAQLRAALEKCSARLVGTILSRD